MLGMLRRWLNPHNVQVTITSVERIPHLKIVGWEYLAVGPDKRLYRKEEWGMTTPEFKVGEKAIVAVEIGGWLRQ